MARYRTKDGDMVDAICRDQYGDEAMTVAVYEANPGLAAKGPMLGKGIVIDPPDVAAPVTMRPVRLWG